MIIPGLCYLTAKHLPPLRLLTLHSKRLSGLGIKEDATIAVELLAGDSVTPQVYVYGVGRPFGGTVSPENFHRDPSTLNSTRIGEDVAPRNFPSGEA